MRLGTIWVKHVVAFYARDFPGADRDDIAAMRLLAAHPAARAVAEGLEAVPFNEFGFGLFPPGRAGDPDSPCLCLWVDSAPLYWVQLRRRVDCDILTIAQPEGADEAWAAAREAVPRLLAEATLRSSTPAGHAPPWWLADLSPITNFAGDGPATRSGGATCS